MSPDAVLDVVTALCLTAGALLSLAAGVALVRFPDLLSRMHAATKPQVLGLLLVLLGCGLQLRNTVDVTTLLLVAVFQLGTAPVAAHMIGRSGYRAGLAHHDVLLLDELADRADQVGAPDRAGDPDRALDRSRTDDPDRAGDAAGHPDRAHHRTDP